MSEPKAGASESAVTGRGRAKHMRPDPGAGVLEWVEGLLRRVVREELALAAHPTDDWRDQSQSPVLGPRRHCRAVRRRLAANPRDPSAKRVGDRFLLTLDAIAEELDRAGHKPDAAAKGVAAPSLPESPESEALARVQRRLQRVK